MDLPLEVGQWTTSIRQRLASKIAGGPYFPEVSVLEDSEGCAEPEAVDVLLEVDQLGWLEQYVDAQNYARTCLYLASCCSYLPEADDRAVLHAAFSIYMKVR